MLALLCLHLAGPAQAPAVEIFSLGEAGFPCWRVPVRAPCSATPTTP